MRRARGLGKAFQLVRSPKEALLRRRLARKLGRETEPPFVIGDGYVRFTADDLPHGRAALEVCQEISEDEKATYVTPAIGKGFLRTLLTPERLREHPELLAFATSKDMIAIVSRYLGTVPTLADLRLWWSVPSDVPKPPSESQKFHRDHEDYRQVKVFVNVRDIDADAGPFTLVPASVSSRLADELPDPYGRVEDADVLPRVQPEDVIVLTGQAGEAAMVDTCRCFHYGSRNDRKERLVLMLHYLSFTSIFEPDTKVVDESVRAEWQARDPMVASVMRARPARFPDTY
jgi:hypothetical protein